MPVSTTSKKLSETKKKPKDPLRKYLEKMECPVCKGRGCEQCNYSGDSPEFMKLLKESTKGLRQC